MRQATVGQLFEHNKDKLRLKWLGGDLEAAISVTSDGVSPADLVGHLNLIHPDRIQVLGNPEIEWALRQEPDKVEHHLNEIIAAHPPAVVVADGCTVPAIISDACDRGNTALFSTTHSAAGVIDSLRIYLSRQLADTVSIHGVLMDVLGMGVLITGESGVGKSELALELISRGHGLVADDVVEISRVAPHTLEGRCPPLLRDFLEVRGLGVLNIRTVFGETACRRKMKVKMVVHLDKPQKGVPEATRLPLDAVTQEILGVPIRRVVIPVAAGRNMAVLLEAAVRSTILLLRGIDSTQEFVQRQQQIMRDDNDDLITP